MPTINEHRSYIKPLALLDPNFDGSIARKDIEQHKSSLRNPIYRKPGDKDACHLVPAQWFVKSVNAIARRQPKLRADILQIAKKAANQIGNFYIGDRRLNQLKGSMIGRTAKLLLAHDKIDREIDKFIKAWPKLKTMPDSDYKDFIKKFARQIEAIIFNPSRHRESAFLYGLRVAKRVESEDLSHRTPELEAVSEELSHLEPVIQALMNEIHALGVGANCPVKSARSIQDLLVGIVDSVCVDPSQVANPDLPDEAQKCQELFRSMQNSLVLKFGQQLVTSITGYSNAYDAKNYETANKFLNDHINALKEMGKVDEQLSQFWQWSHATHWQILSGIVAPETQTGITYPDIEKAILKIRQRKNPVSKDNSQGENPVADYRILTERSSESLCNDPSTPGWLRDIREYMRKAAQGKSMFDPSNATTQPPPGPSKRHKQSTQPWLPN